MYVGWSKYKDYKQIDPELNSLCSHGLSAWAVGSYSLVYLLVYLKYNSMLTPLTSLVLPQYCYLSVRSKLDWRDCYNMHSNTTAFRSGLCYVEVMFTLHLNKILSASCSACTISFSKIQRKFLSRCYLLVTNSQIFTRYSHSSGLIFTDQFPVWCFG